MVAYVNAWIEPDGTFHHVPVGKHDVVARQLGYGTKETAMACGLVRVGILNGDRYDVDYWRTISEAQYTALYELISVSPDSAHASINHVLATAEVR